jgi:hypothetical protein
MAPPVRGTRCIYPMTACSRLSSQETTASSFVGHEAVGFTRAWLVMLSVRAGRGSDCSGRAGHGHHEPNEQYHSKALVDHDRPPARVSARVGGNRCATPEFAKHRGTRRA